MLAALKDETVAPRPPDGDVSDHEQEERDRQLFALGKFVAMAVLHSRPLPLAFNMVLCKHFLKQRVDVDDLRRFDDEFFKLRVQRVLEPDGLEFMEATLGDKLTFMSIGREVKSAGRIMHVETELIRGGAEKIVDESNKAEYIRLLVEDRLCGSFRTQLSCLLRGFWEVLPAEDLLLFNVSPRDLALMISGVVDFDPEELKRNSDSIGSGRVLGWFWAVVGCLTSEERCKLLHFTTGSSRMPVGGPEKLDPRFKVEVAGGESLDHLPHAHTCFNHLVLPAYTSKEQLQGKLMQAIYAEGFGFL